MCIQKSGWQFTLYRQCFSMLQKCKSCLNFIVAEHVKIIKLINIVDIKVIMTNKFIKLQQFNSSIHSVFYTVTICSYFTIFKKML
ncbi:unnamed protein product [Brugia timori]|uniref:Uncharacterized protein n=1 Tax=Brugia timori TaxID=42155 RepID=A0A0R3RDH0_9BILA|nr:unnamed protein product [Brugia timori]